MNKGPERILSNLKENCANDENIEKFLVEIFNEELIGIHFWKKTYTKILKKQSKNWRIDDEN